ncbi:MAG: hypothetical protein K2K69_01185 [Muribaculaceae bacterium]|nr:hypothetical protein [Muribaculaceae bacterium]
MGFGMFQTPNGIVMVMATPVNRSGGAGGMQSTARLVGQTLGATMISVVFGLAASEVSAVRLCLIIAAAFSACAGILSYTRTLGHKSELHM